MIFRILYPYTTIIQLNDFCTWSAHFDVLRIHVISLSLCVQVELCQQCIEWARQENRVFLRQALEARLVALYVDHDEETQALGIANPLLKELKKIDDKALLVEVSLPLSLSVVSPYSLLSPFRYN